MVDNIYLIFIGYSFFSKEPESPSTNYHYLSEFPLKMYGGVHKVYTLSSCGKMTVSTSNSHKNGSYCLPYYHKSVVKISRNLEMT